MAPADTFRSCIRPSSTRWFVRFGKFTSSIVYVVELTDAKSTAIPRSSPYLGLSSLAQLMPPQVPKSSAAAVPSHLAATPWESGALFARISSSSSSLPQRTLRYAECFRDGGLQISAAHLDQGLGHIIREVAAHISYLTTLSDQLANFDFGNTAQGRHLLAGSVSRQTIALCHSLQGAQFFRAEGAN
eukprot:643707-Pleurochrysis_carterae.AAC.1